MTFSNCFVNNADDGSYTVFTASCKRSFSKLKLVLSYLMPHLLTINQGRLCDIALIRIERDETAKAYFWWNCNGTSTITWRNDAI